MKPSAISGERDSGLVRLYAWIMIVAAAVTTVVALKTTSTDARYSASAEVLISPTITLSGNYIQPSMPTEQRVATSTDVVNAAAATLKVTPGLARENLSVTVPVDTQVLVISYSADTPAAAVAGARVMAQNYLKLRNPSNGKNAVASLVGPPELPSAPVATNYEVVLAVAVLGGLLTGFVIGWTWDRVRGRVRTVAEAERRTELDALAVLPRPSGLGDQQIVGGRSQVDSLAARVLGEVEGGPQFSLLVTGVGAGCNSTGVAVQTARSLARMGRVAILATADPDVIASLSRNATTESVSEASLESSEGMHPGLHLVNMEAWDGEGVAAAKLTTLLPELHERMPDALVVIDGPPAWQSAGMALRADRILLVVAPGWSSRVSTRAAVQSLDHCWSKVMGLVVAPCRGRVRVALAEVRVWAMVRARMIMSRVAPLAPETELRVPMPTVLAPAISSTRTTPQVNGSSSKSVTKSGQVGKSGRSAVATAEPLQSSAS